MKKDQDSEKAKHHKKFVRHTHLNQPHISINQESIEEVVEEMHLDLPSGRAPWSFKIIALVTLIGGLSLVGGLLVDIVKPAGSFNTALYLLRIIFGFFAILVSYGLAKRESWAVWLYGLMVFVSFFISPLLSIIPTMIVIYLITERRHLKASFIDSVFDKLEKFLKKKYKSFLKRRTKQHTHNE